MIYGICLFVSDLFDFSIIPPICMLLQWQNFALYHGWVIFHCVWAFVYICICVYMHIFITHLSISYVNGHLASIDAAAMNVGVHVSFQIHAFVFSYIYSGVEFLGHMVVLFLVFREPSILFSTVAVPIYIPTSSVQGFPFLHIFTNVWYLSYFWW